MLSPDTIERGQRVFAVCNACRYCEGFCPVFPAMEQRLVFGKNDLAYLANLCHNCGECLYACQYAPPHEFGINVPRTMAEIRVASYEEYGWPAVVHGAFRRHGVAAVLTLAVVFTAILLGLALASDAGRIWPADSGADFYRIMPHRVMVALFGLAGGFAALALAAGCARAARAFNVPMTPGLSGRVSDSPVAPGLSGPAHGGVESPALPLAGFWCGLRDALTLRHLHGAGADCTSGEETRSPWRRWFHHLTLYGFLLSFASTSVAAVYHTAFGWRAPYAYTSLPVVLGAAGGIGLFAGPAGLFFLRRRRDKALMDPAQEGLDTAFIALLLLASVTGLLLLALRATSFMAVLLFVHLGVVLALFVTLPYGKFVHGFYRVLALVQYAKERPR